MMKYGHERPNFTALPGLFTPQSCAGVPEQGRKHQQLTSQPGQGLPDRKEKKSLPPSLQTWMPLVSRAQLPKIGSVTPKQQQTKQNNGKLFLLLVGGKKKVTHCSLFLLIISDFFFIFIFISLTNAQKEHLLREGASLSSCSCSRFLLKLPCF